MNIRSVNVCDSVVDPDPVVSGFRNCLGWSDPNPHPTQSFQIRRFSQITTFLRLYFEVVKFVVDKVHSVRYTLP